MGGSAAASDAKRRKAVPGNTHMVDVDKKRVEIWVALSDLFCDTEPDYYYIAGAVKGNTIDNLKNIFFEEVAPVCGPNLMTTIPPVWSGFNEEQLVDGITEMLERNGRSFVARALHATTSLFMRFWFRSLWRETEERLNYYWTRPTPQPLQLASLAFEAALREEKVFHDFLPGIPGDAGSPLASCPDLILAYFSQCVASGMEYREDPERLAPLFEKARRDIVTSLGGCESSRVNGLLDILGATAAGAGCLLARGCPLWPETVAPLARLIASGHPPDKEEAEDVSTIECYLFSLDADSPETDDWSIIVALLRLVSNADAVSLADAYDDAPRKARKLAADTLAKLREAHGTSEEQRWLKDALSGWEFLPHTSRAKLALALYYKSLNLLERY